ncbi:Uncharacterised protein [Enterobacter cloacae]|nr:hypothetical protein SM87_05569 [Klebsiella pneumoniae]SAI07495.1 Uncharacterised protein [Enterobacter cloacae]
MTKGAKQRGIHIIIGYCEGILISYHAFSNLTVGLHVAMWIYNVFQCKNLINHWFQHTGLKPVKRNFFARNVFQDQG